MRLSVPPVVHGVALGYSLPMVVSAPAVVWGGLFALLSGVRIYFLLPVFVLLLVPGYLMGFLVARYYFDRRDTWRFGLGLFVGGSIAAALLFWLGGGDFALQRRIVTAAFGGPLLGGFWQWLGCLLGATHSYGRMDRSDAARADTPSSS